jgi:competence CoiA-like predicted nuclease
MSIKLNSLADIQHELLAPVQWAMNNTYHTTLQVTSAQLAFHHHDMVMPTSFMAHWQYICQRRQAITNHDNLHKNAHQVPHAYSLCNLVLIHQDTRGNLPNPHMDPTD